MPKALQDAFLWMAITGLTLLSSPLLSQCISGDCVNGKGIFIYPDQSIYIGAFRAGSAVGRGACYYHSGAYYEGQFWGHNFQGLGALYTLDRTLEYGLWNRGALERPLAPPAPSARPPRVWVLSVGINAYPALSALRYAEQDALRYAGLHQQLNQLSDTRHVKLLLGSQATRSQIITALHEVGQQMQAQDWFFFFFSGHGLAKGIIPYDGDATDSLSISYEQLHHLLTHAKAAKVFAVVDACHAGQLHQDIEALYRGPSVYRSPMADIHQSKVNYLLSSSAEQYSLEDNNLLMSVQTYFILKGMKGAADVDKNGEVNVQELTAYVIQEVDAYSGHIQTPMAILNNALVPMAVLRLLP